MKTYLKNKIVQVFNNDERIRMIYFKPGDNFIDTYALNCPDSIDSYNNIKIALDDEITMQVGDDLGMIVHLLPHHYSRTNPYKLTTSNKTIVSVDGMIMTANKAGTAIITATTLDGNYSDSITVNVIEPYEFTASTEKTYILNPEYFGLISDDYTQEQAWKNSNALRAIIQYLKENGYNKVIFQPNKHYYYDPANSIFFRSNLIIDLNGSIIQAYPNFLYTYTGMYMYDSIKGGVNICPQGWEGLTSTGYVNYKIGYGKNENGSDQEWFNELKDDYIYPLDLTNGGETGIYYVNGNIPIVDSFTNPTDMKIVKGVTYSGFFRFVKYRVYENKDDTYTNNVVTLTIEYYKNDSLVASNDVVKYNWNKNLSGREAKFEFIIDTNKDYDYIKIKASGLSDATYPVNAYLYDVKIYKKRDIEDDIQNVTIMNGSILGDRNIKDESDNFIKKTLFEEKYGVSWSDCPLNEGTLNIQIDYGTNITLKDLDIGETTGFNMGLGYGKQANVYYPNANTFEYGNFDVNGNKIDSEVYCRSSAPIEVDTSLTNYLIITDPTFTNIFYYGYRSRIIDVYCYDSDMNLLKSFIGKLRHGLLKIPKNTKYINLAVQLVTGEEIQLSGNSDYGNCIFALRFVYPMLNCKIKNCTIHDNYSCGIAHSGMNVTIDNCTFYNNTGRMPWCDIDSEDGWVKMQNNVFKNSRFQSYYGLIMCAGTNYIFKNNEISSFTGYDQMQFMKWYGNNFLNTGYPSMFKCQQDCYMINNNFAAKFHYITGNVNENYACGVYTANNVYLNGCSISNNSYMENNKYFGDILVKSELCDIVTNGYTKDKYPDITSLSYYITNVYDSIYKELPITIGTNSTFNNCEFELLPTVGNYTATFNNCTIYNPKESNKYIINDNCEVIDTYIQSHLKSGMVMDNLVYSLSNPIGKFNGLNKYIAESNNEFTIVCLIEKLTDGTNFGVKILKGNNLTISSYHNGGGGMLSGKAYDLEGNTSNIYKYSLANMDYTKYHVFTIVYSKSANNIKIYINATLNLNYSPNDGYYLKDDSYSINKDNAHNAKINKMYLYNTILTEEQISTNVNALLSE